MSRRRRKTSQVVSGMARKSTVQQLSPEIRSYLERRIVEGRLTLDELIEKCRHIKPSIEQHRQMVRSFVYGNCNLDNPDVTYELVCRVEKEMFDASR